MTNAVLTDPWRQAFCRLYGTERPVVPLGRIMHWRAVAGALPGGSFADSDPALITGGYFYRPHTTAPSAAELDALPRDDEARWVLCPVVRHGEGATLAERGFTELPWFLEAELIASDDVDRDLRASLGGARFRELRRLARRAEADFRWEVAEITEDTLLAFDRLHRQNLAKYGHAHNHFSLEILRDLRASPLGDRLCLFLHRDRHDAPVQAVLGLRHPESLELLVQGIDHAAVPPSHNLYAAALYRIYHWGADHGLSRFNLGRGAALAKLNLGANRFHVVANHIDGDVGALREAACAAMDQAVATLCAAAGRRAESLVLPRRTA